MKTRRLIMRSLALVSIASAIVAAFLLRAFDVKESDQWPSTYRADEALDLNSYNLSNKPQFERVGFVFCHLDDDKPNLLLKKSIEHCRKKFSRAFHDNQLKTAFLRLPLVIDHVCFIIPFNGGSQTLTVMGPAKSLFDQKFELSNWECSRIEYKHKDLPINNVLDFVAFAHFNEKRLSANQ